MSDRKEIIFILQSFLDDIYDAVFELHGGTLKKRSGSIDYQSGKFMVYLSVFPHEIELIFEDDAAGVIKLIACTPEGTILNDEIFSVRGAIPDIKVSLERHTDYVINELSKFLRS